MELHLYKVGWTMLIRGWGAAMNQFAAVFGERVSIC